MRKSSKNRSVKGSSHPLAKLMVMEKSPFVDAIHEDNDEKIKQLIESGVDVNKPLSAIGVTALHLAIFGRKKKAIEALIDMKADVNACTKAENITSPAQELISSGTPLHSAAVQGVPEIIKLLIEKKANVNALDECGNTALHVAVHGSYENNLADAIKVLIDNRADLTLKDRHGTTPVVLAYAGGEQALGELLSRAEQNIKVDEKTQSDAQNALFNAVFDGAISDAEIAMSKGAKVNVICGDEYTLENAQTLLYIAVHNGRKAMIQLLLDHKANVNQAVGDGSTPLFMACQKNNIVAAQLLLDKKASVNIFDKAGETPMFVASSKGAIEILKLLIMNQANVNTPNNNSSGAFPLFIAAQEGQIKTVKYLLSSGANIYQTRKDGVSVFRIASEKGRKVIADLLKEKIAELKQAELKQNAEWVENKSSAKMDKQTILERLRKITPDVCRAGFDWKYKEATKEAWIVADVKNTRAIESLYNHLMSISSDILTHIRYGKTLNNHPMLTFKLLKEDELVKIPVFGNSDSSNEGNEDSVLSAEQVELSMRKS